MSKETSITTKLAMLAEQKLRGSVIQKHSDALTTGVPDMTWTWATMTTWVEAKRVRVCPGPVLKMLHPRAVQRFTMQRLEKAGSAIYVLYEEKGKATWIARPQDVQPNNTIDMSKLLMHSTGIDHDAVIEFVRGIHLKLKIKCSI